MKEDEIDIEKNVFGKKLGRRFINIGIILFPIFLSLYIVSINSNGLITGVISVPILILAMFFIILLITGIIICRRDKKEVKRELKKPFIIIKRVFLGIYLSGALIVLALLYIPAIGFQDWLITTAMTTMNHQYFATWFYDDYTISMALENNRVIESNEDTNPDLINIKKLDFNKTIFETEYEKEALTKEKGNDLYKIIDIDRSGIKGKLAVIYDPSKVKLGVSNGTGNALNNSYGEFIIEMSKNYKAVIATNAGGFYDPDWNSTGGVPHGIVISEGKLIANNSKAVDVGGIIGFNKENKLVLARMSADEAIAKGIRDCVDFGPFLIVNGTSSFIKGNGGWGAAPRTAIGQRKDGIVLLLVIDGRQPASLGADMNHLTEIMLDYGAYNAANLDGGTSSAMSLNHEIITNPRNGSFQAKTRPVPNAWLVVE